MVRWWRVGLLQALVSVALLGCPPQDQLSQLVLPPWTNQRTARATVTFVVQLLHQCYSHQHSHDQPWCAADQMLGHGLPILSRAVSPQARIRCVMAQATSSLGSSTVVSAYARQPRLLEELGSTFKLVRTVKTRLYIPAPTQRSHVQQRA
jgi:hypothetical protein